MRLKKWVYWISRIALLDQIIVLIYGALSIYGIVYISGYIDNKLIMIVTLTTYIILVPIVYIFLAKKIKAFFEENSE